MNEKERVTTFFIRSPQATWRNIFLALGSIVADVDKGGDTTATFYSLFQAFPPKYVTILNNSPFSVPFVCVTLQPLGMKMHRFEILFSRECVADRSPTEIAREGSEPEPGAWPPVHQPTPRKERKVCPGAGSELFHGRRSTR